MCIRDSYYLVDGAMHLREGEKEYSLKAGDVFLLQPGLVHEGTKPAGCAYYFVHFSNICILPFERETVPLEGDADFFQTYEEGGEGQYDMEHCVLPKLLHIRSEKARAQIAKCFDEAIERARSGAQNYRVFWACKFLEILMAISQNSADAAFEAVSYTHLSEGAPAAAFAGGGCLRGICHDLRPTGGPVYAF